MQTLLAILAAETTTNPAETWYSPGVVGFIATFGVTAAAVALIFDMVRRVRRVRYRAEIQAKLDAEQSTQANAPLANAAQAKTSQAKTAPAKSVTSKPAAPKAPTARAKPARPAPPKKPSRD